MMLDWQQYVSMLCAGQTECTRVAHLGSGMVQVTEVPAVFLCVQGACRTITSGVLQTLCRHAPST